MRWPRNDKTNKTHGQGETTVIKRIGLIATIAGAIVLLLVACGGSEGGDDKKSNAKPVDASVTEVRNAFKNLAKVKAVRAEITAQQIGANGQVANSVFKYDFVPPEPLSVDFGDRGHQPRRQRRPVLVC